MKPRTFLIYSPNTIIDLFINDFSFSQFQLIQGIDVIEEKPTMHIVELLN